LKTSERLWITGHIFGQELGGDETVQSSALSLLDHTHPADAQLLDDAVVRDGLADKLSRGGHWREW